MSQIFLLGSTYTLPKNFCSIIPETAVGRKYCLLMDHIKNTIAKSGLLAELKKRVTKNNRVSEEILSLLSPAQKSQVVSAHFGKGRYVVALKSAYAMVGIRHALRNLHAPVHVYVVKDHSV